MDKMTSSSAAPSQQCSQVGTAQLCGCWEEEEVRGKEIIWGRHLLETNRWQNVSFCIIQSVCGEFMLYLCMLLFAVFSLFCLFLYLKKKKQTWIVSSQIMRVSHYIFVLVKPVPMFLKRYWSEEWWKCRGNSLKVPLERCTHRGLMRLLSKQGNAYGSYYCKNNLCKFPTLKTVVDFIFGTLEELAPWPSTLKR